jgi:hypothetical protein
LRAVVQPGERSYFLGVSPFPDGYEIDKQEFLVGRKLVLPAGKTITATFKIHKKN